MAIYHPSRGGVRGGADQFDWEDVKSDKDRECYLGHTVKASTGRWQKGQDLTWFAKAKSSSGLGDVAANERKAEIASVKQQEEEMMAVALGRKPPPKPAPPTQKLSKAEMKMLIKGETGDQNEAPEDTEAVKADKVKGLGFSNQRLAMLGGGGKVERETTAGTQSTSAERPAHSAAPGTARLAEEASKHKKSKKEKKEKKKKSKKDKREERPAAPAPATSSHRHDSAGSDAGDVDRRRDRRDADPAHHTGGSRDNGRSEAKVSRHDDARRHGGDGRRGREDSPPRRGGRRSPSPRRRRSRSPQPQRQRSRSPPRRHRSRSRSPLGRTSRGIPSRRDDRDRHGNHGHRSPSPLHRSEGHGNSRGHSRQDRNQR